MESIVDKKSRSSAYKDWPISADRFLLYADIMGFKERVYSTDYAELTNQMVTFKEKWNSQMTPLKLGDYIRFAQFSDSVLIVAKGADSKMFNLISKAAYTLMHVSMEMGFPIKGVISKGMFMFDEKRQLYIGKPLVDAALLYDELEFYGIAVHHTAESIVKACKSDKNPYNKSKIYLKSGKTCHYHLCWNLIDNALQPKDITYKCNEWLDRIEENVSGHPRVYVDNTREILKNDSVEYQTITKQAIISN